MKTSASHGFFIRNCFIGVSVVGLAVIILNVTLVRQKIMGLQSDLAAQTEARQRAERNLATNQKKLSATTAARNSALTALATAKEEQQAALASLAEQKRLTAKANAELATASEERNTAQAALARYRATDMEPEQIIKAGQQIKQLTAALTAAEKTNTMLVAQLKRAQVSTDGPILLPSKLTAKVLASDPKWRFILVDAGESNGMVANAELLVRRQGKLVARARVTRVQEDRAIADLMPGWELAEVQEGDVVIPAYPRS